ncbi:MAG: branched-chain amino acid transaminase [Cyanobacteria bacterium NC_groundwater_1444_Ag_S-0.65um_54_12]|nr:branched-chain amino acid transaminase [Cyanobacteria bacterium NC_groundwater_1444_Ag_S-0.65um_54_12]
MGKSMAYFKGENIPLEEAKISIMTHGFNYGTGCFEGIRGYWNKEHGELYILHLAEHFRRMAKNAKILFMNLPADIAGLCDISVQLARETEFNQDLYLRPTLYKADEVIGVRLHGLKDAFHIYCAPMGTYVDIDRPLHLGTSSWRRIADTAVPARAKIIGAYINSALCKTEAIMNGFDEGLFLNEDGHVCEGSAENLFMVRDGTLVTPSVADNILEGITRSSIMEIAERDLGIKCQARTIDRTEIYIADELFICGTGAQIAWVSHVDHRTIGTGQLGPITEKIREIYFKAVHGELPQYSHWLTSVYGTAAPGRAATLASTGKVVAS